MNPRSPQDHVDETAARWAVRLECGPLSADEHTAFSTWLDADPHHRRAFDEYRQVSSELDAHIEVQLGAAAEAAVRARTTARKWQRSVATLTVVAAAVITLVMVVNRGREYTTGTAERRVFTLEDGSRVDLNAQSVVKTAFRRGERRVRLTKGEALFDVAADAGRPFVVETAVGTVRAIGTVFDVRSTDAHRVEVTVLDGTVRIESGSDTAGSRTATRGQQAIVTPQAIAIETLPEGAAQDAVAWREGRVIFDETPLREVVARFAAYHRRAIVVEPGAADLRLGGQYCLSDLDGLIESIEHVLPVRVTIDAGKTVRIAVLESRPTDRP